MAVYINHKEYEFIEEMSIFEFIRYHQIFLPSFDEKLNDYNKEELCYVEIEEQSQLVNAKEITVLDGMSIITNSKKVYSYLYNFGINYTYIVSSILAYFSMYICFSKRCA